jgi:hypothetical protein
MDSEEIIQHLKTIASMSPSGIAECIYDLIHKIEKNQQLMMDHKKKKNNCKMKIRQSSEM